MARGLLSGVAWGLAVSTAVVVVVSQVGARREFAVEPPAAAAVDLPPGTEFNRARPDAKPVLPDSDPAPETVETVPLPAPTPDAQPEPLDADAPPEAATPEVDLALPELAAPVGVPDAEAPVATGQPPQPPRAAARRSGDAAPAVPATPELSAAAPQVAGAPLQDEEAVRPTVTADAAPEPAGEALPPVEIGVEDLPQVDDAADAPEALAGMDAFASPEQDGGRLLATGEEAEDAASARPEANAPGELADTGAADLPPGEMEDAPTSSDPAVASAAPTLLSAPAGRENREGLPARAPEDVAAPAPQEPAAPPRAEAEPPAVSRTADGSAGSRAAPAPAAPSQGERPDAGPEPSDPAVPEVDVAETSATEAPETEDLALALPSASSPVASPERRALGPAQEVEALPEVEAPPAETARVTADVGPAPAALQAPSAEQESGLARQLFADRTASLSGPGVLPGDEAPETTPDTGAAPEVPQTIPLPEMPATVNAEGRIVVDGELGRPEAGGAPARPAEAERGADRGSASAGDPTDRLPRVSDATGIDGTGEATLPALLRNALPFEAPQDRPLLSVILLDTGGAIPRLAFPVTLAIPAQAPDAADRAAAARAAGHEVVVIPAHDGADGLLLGAGGALDDAVAVLGWPDDATGTTAAGGLVERLARSGHGLVTFQDERDPAQQIDGDVPAAQVTREIDAAGQDARAVQRFLDNGAFRARVEQGAILVGRTRPETLRALRQWVAEGRAADVALAPVSAILRAGQ